MALLFNIASDIIKPLMDNNFSTTSEFFKSPYILLILSFLLPILTIILINKCIFYYGFSEINKKKYRTPFSQANKEYDYQAI